ncbi:hypothetical protein J1N35_023049, partial [Gossypium stocksii]
MLGRFNASSGKHDEILVVGKKGLRKNGIGYVKKNRKLVMQSPTIFVKDANSVNKGKFFKNPTLIRVET